MHPRRKDDGLVLPKLSAPVIRAVVSHFDVGCSTADNDARLAGTAPLLVVLGTEGDEPQDWLAAGQALQRVPLVAASAGLQASCLNQPCQLPELRPRLAEVVRAGDHPQVMMRLGYTAKQPPATPRRPLSDVVESG